MRRMMLRRDMLADLRALDMAANLARAELLALPFWRWRARARVEDRLLRADVEADRLRKDLYAGTHTNAPGCPKEGLQGRGTIEDKGEQAKGQEGVEE